MEPLRLIVQSDPTGKLAEFRQSLRETIKPVESLEGSLRLVNAGLETLTGRLAASAAALSSSGFTAMASGAKDAADAVLKQAQAEREMAQAAEARVLSVLTLKSATSLATQEEERAALVKEKHRKATADAEAAELRLSQAKDRAAASSVKQNSDADKFLQGLEKEVVALKKKEAALGGDSSALRQYEAALLGVKSKAAPLISEIERLGSSLKQSQADKAARDFNTLAEASPKAAASIKQTEEALLKASQGSTKAGDSFRKMVDSQQALELLKAKIAAVESQIKTLVPGSEAAKASLEQLARLNIGADKIGADISKTRSELSGVSKESSGATEALAVLGFKSLTVAAAVLAVQQAVSKVSQEFSKAITVFGGFDDKIRIAASYTGDLDATSESFFRLSQMAKQVGRDTSISATQAAEALQELAGKGYSASQQIALMPKEVALAESAQIGLKEATEITVKALKAYEFEAEEAGRVNDIISFTAQNSGATVGYLGQAFTQALIAGEGAGLKFEEVAASLAIFGDSTIEAGTASRAIRSVLLSMQAPTSRAAAEYERLGIKLKDSQGNMRRYAEILGELKQKNIGLVESNELFGRYFAASAIALVDGSSKIKYLTEAYKELNGVTEDTAKFQQEGIGGALRVLSGSIDLLYNEIGGLLAPAVIVFSKSITTFVNDTASIASTLNPLIESGRLVSRLIVNTYSIFETFFTIAYKFKDIVTTAFLTPLRLVADGLKALDIIKENPFKTLSESLSSFSKDVGDSFGNLENRGRTVENAFDSASSSVDSLAEKRRKVAEADKEVADLANAAGVKAATLAKNQGKTALEAVEAAKSARKAYIDQGVESKKLAELDTRLASSRKRTAEETSKAAEAAKLISLEAGYSAAEAKAAYDKIIEGAGKSKESVSEVTKEMNSQAKAINDSGEKIKEYTSLTGRLITLESEIKLAKDQIKAFGPASDIGRAALDRFVQLDFEKGRLKDSLKKTEESLENAGVTSEELASKAELAGLAAESASTGVSSLGKSASEVSATGVSSLNAGLDQTKIKADQAQSSLAGIAGAKTPTTPSGGTVSYAQLDITDYESKTEWLKKDIASFKEKNRWVLRTESPEFEPIRAEYKRLQDELARNEPVSVLTQKMAGLRGELDATKNKLSETKQVFTGGKLSIDTDPEISNELERQAGLLKEQINILSQQKFVAESTAGSFEIVGGEIRNISPAVQAAKSAYDSLRDSSGNIKTEWKEIGGVWQEVLPSGKSLLEEVDSKMKASLGSAGQLGPAISEGMSGAAGAISAATAEANKLTAAAGSAKFDELISSMAGLDQVREKIKLTETQAKLLGIETAAGKQKMVELFTLQGVEDVLQKKIGEQRKAIYEQGKEAEEAAKKIKELSREVNTAYANVNQLGNLKGFGSIVSELKTGAASAASSVAGATITELAQAMTVAKALKEETSSLEKYIEAVGPASAEGQKALAKLITAQGIESEAQKKVSELKAEVDSLAETISATSELKLLEKGKETSSIVNDIKSDAAAISGGITSAAVDELAGAIAVSKALEKQVSSLGKYIDTVGASSKEGKKALAELLNAEASSDVAKKKVEELRNEIKGVSDDAEKAKSKLEDFGSVTTGEFTVSGIGKSLQEMTDKELNFVIESQKEMSDILRDQAKRIGPAENSVGFGGGYSSGSTIDADKNTESLYDEYWKAQMEKLKRAANTLVSGVEDSARSVQRGSAVSMRVGAGGTGTAAVAPAPTQQPQGAGQSAQVTNITYNSYAVPLDARLKKQEDRRRAQQ